MKKSIREIRIDGNVAYVPLTRGCTAIIDAIDVPLLGDAPWRSMKGLYGFIAVRSSLVGEGKRRTIYMHRVLTKAPSGMDVDHINGNTLDNRRSNLRVASHSENATNRRVQSNNMAQMKGVGRYVRSGKWRARIRVNGVERSLGYFASPELAAEAYRIASLDLHGEFSFFRREEISPPVGM